MTFRLEMNRKLSNEITKYERTYVKKRQHTFGQIKDESLSFLDNRGRNQLSLFFNAWLTHHIDEKRHWGKTIKMRYQLNSMFLNRVLQKWKEVTRAKKIVKVKEALLLHSHTKFIQKQIIKRWRVRVFKMKSGVNILQAVADRFKAKRYLRYNKHRGEQQLIKQE